MRFWATILAVYFLLLSLAPNWQGLEFFKTDALIAHYASYQKEAKDPSFLAFIQAHYIQQISEPHTEHRQLPFKSCAHQITQCYFQECVPIQTNLAIVQTELIHERNHVAPHNVAVNDYFQFWHPPQL